MKPTHGARFTLRLTQTSPSVVYQFEARTPDSTLSGVATVEPAGGKVSVTGDPELPPWFQGAVTGLLRSLWRARQDGGSAPPWPRRLTRWRGADGARTG